MGYMYVEYKREQNILYTYVNYIKSKNTESQVNKDSFITATVRFTHHILGDGNKEAMLAPLDGFGNLIASPIEKYVLTKDGACGSNAMVCAQILQANDIKVRLLQMDVGGKKGGHITLEALSSQGWVTLDPMYNLVFKNAENKFLSAKELQNNFDQSKGFLPLNYKAAYRYENFSYTNWEKIPIVLPALKSLLNVLMGKEKADEISVRTWFLNPKKTIINGFVVLFFLVATIRVFKLFKPAMRSLVRQIGNFFDVKIWQTIVRPTLATIKGFIF
jgi:hypothetical protein